MFRPLPTRIEDVLNSPTQFAIPVYQREFKWGKDEALELIEDLKNYPDGEGENLFLGNLIFEKTKSQKTFVIDGQQRLSTIILLLVACRMHAKALRQEPLATTIQSKITFIDSTTAESLGPRLIASESIRTAFEYVTNANWDGKFPTSVGKKPVKRQINRIRPIYDFFLKEVGAFDLPQLSKFLGAIYNTYVVRIDIESETEALAIFERTNARGLDLEVSDLLKNYLFAEKVEGVEDLWDQIVHNSEGTMLRMLKYFYVSKKGYILKPQLYRKLKAHGAEVGPKQLTEELVTFSRFYQLVKKPSKEAARGYFDEIGCGAVAAHQNRFESIASSLQALREFNVVQFCPVAYSAIQCLIRHGLQASNPDAKELVKLFTAFEKYHFINNMVCERVGNEVEKLYAEACESFGSAPDLKGPIRDLTGSLREKLATEGEFIENFTELAYAQNQISLLCYVFDRINNHKLDPAQRIPIFNPDAKISRKNHNIEHFFPQRPDPNVKVKKETIDEIDNIGNLLAIYFRTNSRLGNGLPEEKIARLKGDLSKDVQNLSYVSEFIAKYEAQAPTWNGKTIRDRARDMASQSYREVWQF